MKPVKYGSYVSGIPFINYYPALAAATSAVASIGCAVSLISGGEIIRAAIEGDASKLILLPMELGFAWVSLNIFRRELFSSITGFAAKRSLKKKLKEITPENAPLQFVDEIEITDKEGLEKILDRTWECERLEWGTVLRSVPYYGKAVTVEIEDPDDSGKFIIKRERTQLFIDRKAISENGYNGVHHFHPRLFKSDWNAIDYTVSAQDRNQPREWINLLSFNLKNGPEIIGYNLKDTFIPADKTKRRLVKAGPEEIKKYLLQ